MKGVENIKKGWLTSIVGAIMMIGSFLIALGFVEPKTDVSNTVLFVVWIIGCGFLFAPATIEERLKKLITTGKFK